MSEPNGKSASIDLDKLGSQLVERAEWLALNGDDVSASVILRARRAIGILLSQLPGPEQAPKPEEPAKDAGT